MIEETLIEKLRGYKSTPRHCEELCYEAANVIESMIQKLIAAQEASEFDHSEYRRLRAELCQQLAAALAAIKSKDAALQSAISAHKYESGDLHEALAIQPDDAALKPWLGEPYSYTYRHNSEFGDGTFWSHRPTHNGNTALESMPLYSPKGLK